MAVAFLLVFGAGFLLTGFELPVEFFISFGLANLAIIATGMWHLRRDGYLRVGMHIVPGPRDVAFITSSMWGYGIGAMTAVLQRVRRNRHQ